LLLTFIAWRTNWSDVAQRCANLDVQLWLAAVGFYMLALIASARRWQLYAKELGFEHSLPRYCAYSFIGMFFGLVLPTVLGGDVMRVWYLTGQSGRKWAALASVFLERVSGLFVLIATACVGVLIAPVELPWWIVASVWGTALCAGLGFASVPILKSWQSLPIERRQQLQMFLDLLQRPKTLIESGVLSVLVQIAGVLMLWCLGAGLGLDVPVAYYCVMGPMVSLLMMLPISVNGMGVREGGTVLFLLPLGIDESAALTLAFLWFTPSIAMSLVGGVVYLCGFVPSTAEGGAGVPSQVANT
jgi:hypothetical protein